MKRSIPLVVIAALFTLAGCEKKETVRSDAPPAAPAAQVTTPATAPTPERPAPDVSKSAAADYPKPGQANNHSSPGFKGGGDSDKK